MFRNRVALLLAFVTGLIFVARAEARVILAEAFAGQPYNVGHVVMMVDDQSASVCSATSSWKVSSPNDRIHYPVLANGKLGQLFELFTGEQLGGGSTRVEAFFLFSGNDPLQVTLYAPRPQTVTVVPAGRPLGFRRTMRRWWRERESAVRRRGRVTDYPPLTDEYLKAMLARKLNFSTPPVRLTDWTPKQATGLLLGSEKQHLRVFREVVNGCSEGDVATLPLPQSRTWVREALPEFEKPEVEPIAKQVPANCFYARFGSFSNFFWLVKLTEEFGGDLSRMVTLRGSYPRYTERIEEQLGIKDLPFAEQLGDTFIQDMAFIGRDLFMSDGAAVGVVLHSKNPLFTAGIQQLRKDVQKKFADQGATLKDAEIAGEKVTLLSTPSNQVLSYHVRRGQYHLVTNCRDIMASFLAIDDGKGSIAEDPEFQFARSQFPVERQDTVFGFVPRECLEQLASPSYQIELYRRLRAVAEMEATQLARLAYTSDFRHGGRFDAEKQVATVAELQATGYLPGCVGLRPDGSQLVYDGLKLTDSMRGQRGSFRPIPDVEVSSATAHEVQLMRSLDQFFTMQAPSLSPMCFAMRRKILDQDASVERLSFEGQLAPFKRSNYRTITGLLGEPTTEYVAPPESAVVSANFVVRGPSLLANREARHIALAMPDLPPTIELKAGGLLSWLSTAKALPLTVSATNDVELLRRYAGLLGDRDDAFGYAQLPFQLWRRRMEDYTAYSFNHRRLEELQTPIPLAAAKNPAQLRVSIGDLAGSRFSDALNAVACDRALRASLGNTRMIHDLSNQFNLSRAEGLATAQRLLGTDLICSLGGEYELVAHQNGLEQWTSTAWSLSPPIEAVDAESYTAPMMRWLRGLELEASLDNRRAAVSGHVDVERIELPKEPGKKASIFDLFKSKKKKKAKVDDEP